MIECLAAEYGVPYAKLDARLLDPKVVDVLPREYVEKNLVLPLFLVRGVLTIAVSEPSNLFLIDEVRGLTGAQVQIVAASPKDIRRMIATLAELQGLRDRRHHRGRGHGGRDADRGGHRGHRRHAGDRRPIARHPPGELHHFQRREGGGQRRPRRAGRALRCGSAIASTAACTRRWKCPSTCWPPSPAASRSWAAWTSASGACPRTGEVHVMLEGRKIDLRVSTFPAARGEKTVIRVLDTRAVSLEPRRPGIRRRRADRLPAKHPRPQRHRPGDRADGQRKIDHALRRPRTPSARWKTTSAPLKTRSNTTCR